MAQSHRALLCEQARTQRWSPRAVAPVEGSHDGLIIAFGGIILIVMGVLIWTGELYRINIEIQNWMTNSGIDFWSDV